MSSHVSTERHEFVAVFALAVAAHSSALSGGFIWLDHAHLQNGLALAPPGQWLELFTRGFADTGYYRPLMAWSLSLDEWLSGSARWYRAVTLAWHGAAAVLTTVATKRLGLSPKAALAAGLLFAAHPLTSLVASATAFRSEAMVAVFLLGLIIAHRAQRPLWAGLALGAAALTKETGWVLGPAFVIALEVSELSRATWLAEIRRRRRLFQAEAVAVLFTSGLRALYAPSWRAGYLPMNANEAIGTRLASIAKSIGKAVWPVDVSVCDAFSVASTWSLNAALGAVMLMAAAVLVVKRRRLALLLLLSSLPILQIIPVMRWWSPHYLYLPLVFAAMLLADRLEHWGTRALQGAVAAALACALLSFIDARRFVNDQALWEPELRRNPACREAHFYLGEVARQSRRWDEAARRYELTLQPTPGVLAYADELSALVDLGAVRLAQGDTAAALVAWGAARERRPSSIEGRQLDHNLAVLALEQGKPGEAARLLEAESQRRDALVESLLLRARALHELRRDTEARVLVERAAGSRP